MRLAATAAIGVRNCTADSSPRNTPASESGLCRIGRNLNDRKGKQLKTQCCRYSTALRVWKIFSLALIIAAALAAPKCEAGPQALPHTAQLPRNAVWPSELCETHFWQLSPQRSGSGRRSGAPGLSFPALHCRNRLKAG